MLYKKIIFLSFSTLFFNQLQAIPCSNPAVASDNITQTFHYGCFCGKKFPNIKHSSNKNYKELNQQQTKELKKQYQKLDAFDDIDQICKEHDLCYIQEKKEAGVCNDKIYQQLYHLENKFKQSTNNILNQQCQNLAYDIASVFHTIFAPADDEDGFIDYGMLFFNGALTVANKIVQKSSDAISPDKTPRYPLAHEKCFINNK